MLYRGAMLVKLMGVEEGMAGLELDVTNEDDRIELVS